MSLYLGIGKKLVGFFIAVASIFSQHHTSPKLDTPSQVITSSPQFLSMIPLESVPVTQKNSSTTSLSTRTTKPAYIPVYFNYPEKISIGAKKKIDYNFEKVFVYSLSGLDKTITKTENTSPVVIPIIPPSPVKTVFPVNVSNVNVIPVASPSTTNKAIVNIYCTQSNGRTIQAITGSGVIVSKNGLILTNAHVGEYPLIANNSPSPKLSCTARTGSPVDQQFQISLSYISKDWIEQNPRNISDTSFSENGNSDISLIQLIPSNKGFSDLSYIPLSTSNNPLIGNTVIVSSYPADILGSMGISALLRTQTETLSIVDAFSFNSDASIDLIESGDSLHVQHGSSGGAVINTDGQLEGIIATIVGGNSPFAKHIRAITLSHINNVLRKDTGYSLNTIVESANSIGQLSSPEKNRLSQILLTN